MRAKLYLVFLMTALCLASCDFSQKFAENIAVNYNNLTLKVTASADDAYTDLLQGLWQTGDALKVRVSGAEYVSSTDCVKLDATSDGKTASFEGILPLLTQNDNLYIYYAESGEFAGKDSTGYSIVLPSEQTGKLEDIRSSVLYYSWVRNDSMTPDAQVLEMESQMNPAFALVKINVPAALQAENVILQANKSIVGKLVVQPQKGWGTAGEGTLLSWEEDDSEDADRIVITGEEGRVEGDVYIVLLPDSFDQSYDEYCCSIENLTFSCTYYEGDLTHRFKLGDGLLCGTLTDLGQIPMPKPKIPVEGGKIMMTSAAKLTLAIENPNPDCEYYYEIGPSEAECARPTIDSKKFDPAEGFSPEFTGTFNRYYVKVLAHALDNEHSDVVLTASLRYWTFNKTCPSAAAYRNAATSLTSVGDNVVTSDNLTVYRRASADLTYGESDGSMEFNNCIVPFMSVEKEGQVYMYMCTSNVYNNAKSKTINLFYTTNNFSKINRVNSFNDGETLTKIERPSDAVHQRVSIVWHLGNLDTSYDLAFAPDSKTTYYSQAILEVF